MSLPTFMSAVANSLSIDVAPAAFRSFSLLPALFDVSAAAAGGGGGHGLILV
jgi:hypothetical protein